MFQPVNRKLVWFMELMEYSQQCVLAHMDMPLDMDAILTREREKIWDNIRGMRVDMDVFAVLSYPNMFHNLKAAIKLITYV